MIPYYRGKTDNEMYMLLDYLKLLLNVPDVREVNRRQFKMRELQNSKDVKDYLERLFR